MRYFVTKHYKILKNKHFDKTKRNNPDDKITKKV